MAGEVWCDFRQIKQVVRLDAVLGHYGVLEKFARKGNRLSGPCPVHKGSNHRQFSADLDKGAWKCFSGSCTDAGKKGGNTIDLVAAIENVPFRDAALLLQGWFGITPERSSGDEAASDSGKTPDPVQKTKRQRQGTRKHQILIRRPPPWPRKGSL